VIIRFTVQNYRSILDPVTLDMTATGLRSADPELDTGAVHEVKRGFRLLKAAALFGANASGKSNVLRALGTFAELVVRPFERPSGSKLPYEPFRLAVHRRESPTAFEIEVLDGDVRLRYGFEYDRERVQREWLFRKIHREIPLFTRDGASITVHRPFSEGKSLTPRTRPDALFLSVVAQFNGELAMQVVRAIERIAVGSGRGGDWLTSFGYTMLRTDEALRARAARFVAEMDTSVQGLSVIDRSLDEMPELLQRMYRALEIPDLPVPPRVLTQHTVWSETGQATDRLEFDLDEHESHGTRTLVLLAPRLLHVLDKGKTLVVDDFDALLHPILTRHIIGLFNSTKTNPKGAQLIVASHGAHLLAGDTLRRDQIWLVEKDGAERTTLASLDEFRVRKKAPFDRQYLNGRFGATPSLGDVEAALHSDAAA